MKCKAKTRFDERCSRDAILGGYCITHFALKYKSKKK